MKARKLVIAACAVCLLAGASLGYLGGRGGDASRANDRAVATTVQDPLALVSLPPPSVLAAASQLCRQDPDVDGLFLGLHRAAIQKLRGLPQTNAQHYAQELKQYKQRTAKMRALRYNSYLLPYVLSRELIGFVLGRIDTSHDGSRLQIRAFVAAQALVGANALELGPNFSCS
jgi:hypothetical protein